MHKIQTFEKYLSGKVDEDVDSLNERLFQQSEILKPQNKWNILWFGK